MEIKQTLRQHAPSSWGARLQKNRGKGALCFPRANRTCSVYRDAYRLCACRSILDIKPFCLPIDIQHTQRLCWSLTIYRDQLSHWWHAFPPCFRTSSKYDCHPKTTAQRPLRGITRAKKNTRWRRTTSGSKRRRTGLRECFCIQQSKRSSVEKKMSCYQLLAHPRYGTDTPLILALAVVVLLLSVRNLFWCRAVLKPTDYKRTQVSIVHCHFRQQSRFRRTWSKSSHNVVSSHNNKQPVALYISIVESTISKLLNPLTFSLLW